ncbi:Selenide, water dikinase [bioreactor metagenome]|uniref:Selenide, water dikinase n=1 Tax=bioreactor metagenome TaxID=1076179 RepID=A0A645C068_9ZZZZ
MLFDPQTSGGLLVSISASEGKELMEELSKLEIPCEVIGEVIPKEEKNIIVE